MPLIRFDTGLRYDEGHAYDSSVGPTPGPPPPVRPNKSKYMSKFKLDLKSKTVPEKLSMGTNHITAMDGNTNYPVAKRSPDDAAYALAQSDLAAAEAEVDAAETVWKQKIQVRDVKEEAWDLATTARAANCESITPNNLPALASTGFPLRSAPTPVGPMTAPGNLRATMNELAGQIDLQWNTVYGASTYKVEMMVHNGPGTWAEVAVVQQISYSVTGLTSGTSYAFRVLAIGPLGPGPWSDEAVRMAP